MKVAEDMLSLAAWSVFSLCVADAQYNKIKSLHQMSHLSEGL